MNAFLGFIRLSPALKISTLFLIVGAAALAFSYVSAKQAPSFESLETIDAVVQTAKKSTLKAKLGGTSQTSTAYELSVATKSGVTRNFNAPADALSEATVARLIGKPVRIEASGADAYVIATGSEKLLNYEFAAQKYQQTNALIGLGGGVAVLLGVMLLPFGLIGAWRASRKRSAA